MQSLKNYVSLMAVWLERNSSPIIGACALLLGSMFLYLSLSFAWECIKFLLGLILYYIGLQKLRLTMVTSFIDGLVGKIRCFLRL